MTKVRLELKGLMKELRKQPEGMHFKFFYSKELKGWQWLAVSFTGK